MRGFMPGIHAFAMIEKTKTWMAGTSPAMTVMSSHAVREAGPDFLFR